jgi:hypothetical protein
VGVFSDLDTIAALTDMQIAVWDPLSLLQKMRPPASPVTNV